jgi:glucokinase
MRTKEIACLDAFVAHVEKSVAAAAPGAPLVLAGDVGASNTRLCVLALPLAADTTVTFVKLPARSAAKMIDAVAQVEARLPPAIVRRVVAAAIGVPGAVVNGQSSTIMNFEGKTLEDRTIRVSALPKGLCPPGKTVLLNDLEAAAEGISALHELGAMQGIFEEMWAPVDGLASAAAKKAPLPRSSTPVASLDAGHAVVLAAGTGLGAALLNYKPRQKAFGVLPLEFGHTSVTGPADAEYIVSSFARHVQRGAVPPEYDDICSGRGLEFLYSLVARADAPCTCPQAAGSSTTTGAGATAGAAASGPVHGCRSHACPHPCAAAPTLKAPEITALARGGDVAARHAMTLMYDALMLLSSQLAMGFVPRTIIVAGDNAVRHDWFLSNHHVAAHMRRRLLSHSMERAGFMSRVRVLRQTAEVNLNIIGAVHAAQGVAAEEGGKPILEKKPAAKL